MKSDSRHKALKEMISYDPDTGRWVWLLGVGGKSARGKEAGCICKTTGYRLITVFGEIYRSGRLAWFYMTGEWPEHQIDHTNGMKDDDRWCNLRPATHQQNMCNRPMPRHNTSGMKGVSRRKDCDRWQANIRVNGESILLGLYERGGQAKAAYDLAAYLYHGEYARA